MNPESLFNLSSRSRWQIVSPGKIEWHLNDCESGYTDQVEMSGEQLSCLVSYGITSNGRLRLQFRTIWIALRKMQGCLTDSNFQSEADLAQFPFLTVDSEVPEEYPERFIFDGTLIICSRSQNGLKIERTIFPSVDKNCLVQKIKVTNSGKNSCVIDGDCKSRILEEGRGRRGIYLFEARLHRPENCRVKLAPGEEIQYTLQLCGHTAFSAETIICAEEELQKRHQRICEITSPLHLVSGIPELDTAFYFSKLHVGESIFRTRSGLLHSPAGGDKYYAAIWCNDELEYAAPYFAFTGDPKGLECSLNAFRLYMPFMGPSYKAIPSAIIDEGYAVWENRGDRGDAAMYAYGAVRFSLASGSRQIAEELRPAIDWCLEYCRRRLNASGVPESDTDELEGRLPAGNANLSIACLYYGALCGAAELHASLSSFEQEKCYRFQAKKLARSIENYFGREVSGFQTYRYYEGNDVLRSWIGIPLCMGLFERAEETVKALFSPKLWLGCGMLSAEGDDKVWDRSTLYGFRGAFYSGQGTGVFPLLVNYAKSRLTTFRVPYPIEAWPEGNMRQLSAECALFCRVFTEGIFGMEPAGLNKIRISPNLPDNISEMRLENIRAAGDCFDLTIRGREFSVKTDSGKIFNGKGLQEISFN